MKFAVLVIGLLSSISGNVVDPCRGITIANHVQEKEVLMHKVDSPYHFAIDRKTNTLFFSYSTTDKHNVFDLFKPVFINLKDKTFGIISGISGGFAAAVDHQDHGVYIGGADGLYKYDYETKTAVNLGVTDSNIWQMFFKDGLYFTVYPERKAYLYKDGVVKLVPELKDTKTFYVALDKNNNMYYTESGELKMLVNGGNVTLGDYDTIAFNTDADGDLYFSTPEYIYKLVDGSVSKVTSIQKINGFAIEDDDSFIYADDNSVIRLKPTTVDCTGGKKNN